MSASIATQSSTSTAATATPSSTMEQTKIIVNATIKQVKNKTATGIATVKRAITKLDKAINEDLRASKTQSGTEGRAWKTSLWACCTPWDLAILTMCCPCITFGKTFHRLQNDGDMSGYEQINAACLFYYFARCWCIQPLPICMQYSLFREKHNLEGTPIEDALKAPCCCPALMQIEKESKLVFAEKRGGLDGVIEEQYIASENMVMARKIQIMPQNASAPLYRISEEMAVTPMQDDEMPHEKIEDDGVSEMTAVNAEDIQTQSDGKNELPMPMPMPDAQAIITSGLGLHADGASEVPIAFLVPQCTSEHSQRRLFRTI
ncbi:hypothetical protein IAQ61_007857 [Plenodomus lingam]|uniref:Uncharacterized protein n=1 Tax=Leptosphaeria maculans (strain JN3 / isolate v23.1.3 / race Av1-4-5-6-7-8) TaxID=985895 RepID=E5A5S9_LEPMJ|nr:hypothetical protein LEMA_P077530.1 [Plenodomus lingam JN3]KAH9867265.1 hypothetical protein IAQ61_007857 [Plenodomus lingam]CBX98514.1 hypothetical protein LEMA_P077530.1 [Plenodomus lingam JN3]